MDWATVLLALAFIVVPLLQEVFKSRGKTPPSDEQIPEETGGRGEIATERPRVIPLPTPETVPAQAEDSRDSWSDDWGSWPGAADAPELPEPTTSYQPLHDPPALEVVVDDAPTRLEELAASLNRLAEIESRPLPPVAIRVVPPIVTRRLAGRSHRRENLRLSSSLELRRAIILTEILGPPRSLKPIDSDR